MQDIASIIIMEKGRTIVKMGISSNPIRTRSQRKFFREVRKVSNAHINGLSKAEMYKKEKLEVG